MKRVWTFIQEPNDEVLPITSGDAINFLYDKDTNKMYVVGNSGVIKETTFEGTSSDNYQATNYFNVQAINGETLQTSATMATGTLHLFPFKLDSLLVANTIAAHYVGGGDVSFNLKFGIYKLNAGDLVWESPEMSAISSATTYATTGLNVNIPKGIYFFAVLHNSTLPITLRGGSRANTKAVMRNSDFTPNISTGTINRQSYTQIYTSTLPPSLVGLPGGNSGENSVAVPYIFFKI